MTDRPTAPTDRPGLRPAAPERESVNGHRPTTSADRSTDRRPGIIARLVRSVDRSADRPDTDRTDRTDRRSAAVDDIDQAQNPTGRSRRWRARKPTGAVVTVAATRPTDPIAVAVAASAHRRPTTPTATRPADAEIAPVPQRMKWLAVWLDRTFGAMPLIAPLLVSGYYTMQVFTGDPIDAHVLIAVFAACALEGGVWKLARLYEKTLVAGDSTMALRFGIGMYLALISGLIYWHAGHEAKLRGEEGLGDDALPAIGVAVMSALGVFIWSRTARWTRRQELHAQGRVDTQAPKFAALAWILCPIETPQALRHAVKYRIAGPVQAVADLRLYKSVGKPAVWPPLPTDPDGHPAEQPTDRPAAEPTRPTPTDGPAVPARPVEPTVAPAPGPTPAPASTPTRLARPTVAAPADSTPTDRPAFSPAAIKNAAILRQRYGTDPDLRLPAVRGDTGWSFDRADPALKAYLARADQPTDQEPATDARPLAHTS